MTADEPTAIRHPHRGKAHRLSPSQVGGELVAVGSTRCGKWTCDMTERVPLSQTDITDRCKTCWKDTP